MTLRRWTAILLLTACLIPAPSAQADIGGNELQVHVFQAGKADAYLIFTDDHAVLIDTGLSGFGKDVLKYLEKKEIDSLDALILTHFDKDHIGGAAKLIRSVPIGRVLQSNCPQESEEYTAYCRALAEAGLEAETLRENCSFVFDGVEYTVYPPKRESYSSSPSNNSSLAVSVRFGETGILFTGDAERERINELCSLSLGTFQVLQLPHHGAYFPELELLLSETQPELALISTSDAEPEDERTVDLLENAGIAVYNTRDGKINLCSDGRQIWIK